MAVLSRKPCTYVAASGQTLTKRMLAFDSGNMGMQECVALFQDLVNQPFDWFQFLPPSYSKDRDTLVRLGYITLPTQYHPKPTIWPKKEAER